MPNATQMVTLHTKWDCFDKQSMRDDVRSQTSPFTVTALCSDRAISVPTSALPFPTRFVFVKQGGRNRNLGKKPRKKFLSNGDCSIRIRIRHFASIVGNLFRPVDAFTAHLRAVSV